MCNLQEYDTCSIWFNIPISLRQRLACRCDGAVHAANHALYTSVGIIVDCDLGDIDTEHYDSEGKMRKLEAIEKENEAAATAQKESLDNADINQEKRALPSSPQLSSPPKKKTLGNSSRLLLYDKKPGGTGACEAIYQHVHNGNYQDSANILNCALAILTDCPCDEGCPSCLYTSSCSTHNSTFDKAAGIFLLKELITICQNYHEHRQSIHSNEDICPQHPAYDDREQGGFKNPSFESKKLHAHVSAATAPARKRNFVIKEVKYFLP